MRNAPATWHSDDDVVALQRRTLRWIVLAQVFGAFGTGASASVGVLLVQDVVEAEWLAGIARSTLTLGAALVGIPLALLAVARGRRISLATGWALSACGAVLLVLAAVTGNVVLVVAGMTLFGSGSATTLQSRFAATDLAVPHERGRTLATVVWMGTLGTVVGPNLGIPGAVLARHTGLPDLAGAFAIAAVTSLVAAGILLVGLRPDTLLVAHRHQGAGGPVARVSMRTVLRTIAAIPVARFAVTAVVAGHVAMVALMTMTPVHMDHQGSTVAMVGLTISGHVLGMFALAPVVGWAGDRFGRIPVILLGQAVFVLSVLPAVLVSYDWLSISVVLFLLGLAWSCATVPGSVLLSSSVPDTVRTQAQGAVDTLMNLVAAGAAFAAGPAFALLGYAGLAVGVLGCAAVTVVAAALLPGTDRQPTTGSRVTS